MAFNQEEQNKLATLQATKQVANANPVIGLAQQNVIQNGAQSGFKGNQHEDVNGSKVAISPGIGQSFNKVDTGGVAPANNFLSYLARPAGSLSELTDQQRLNFNAQDYPRASSNQKLLNSLPSYQSNADMNMYDVNAQKAWAEGRPLDWLRNKTGLISEGVNQAIFQPPLNAIEGAIRSTGFGSANINAPYVPRPLTNAVSALAPQQTKPTVEDNRQFEIPNYGAAELDYLNKLNSLRAKPSQIAPANINLGQPQFNQQNIQRNVENALATPGSQIDLSSYNQMLNKQIGGTQGKLSQSEEEKQAMIDKLGKNKTAALEMLNEKGGSFLDSVKRLGMAAGYGEAAKTIEDNLSKMTMTDRTAAQQELQKLNEQMSGAERDRAVRQAGFAQDVSKAGMSSQNQAELNKQTFDEKMKELGIGIKVNDVNAQRAADQEALKYNQSLDKLGIINPQEKKNFINQQIEQIKMNSLSVLSNPNSTPEQRKQAELQALDAQRRYGVINPTEPKYQYESSQGTTRAYKNGELVREDVSLKDKMEMASNLQSQIDSTKDLNLRAALIAKRDSLLK